MSDQQLMKKLEMRLYRAYGSMLDRDLLAECLRELNIFDDTCAGLRAKLTTVEQERDEVVRLSRVAVHEALLSAGHTHDEHTAAVFGQWKQAIDDAIRAEQQLVQRDARIVELEREHQSQSEDCAAGKDMSYTGQIATLKQQLAQRDARIAELEQKQEQASAEAVTQLDRLNARLAELDASEGPTMSLDDDDDTCGFCQQPGADKVPHPVRWPGEESAGTRYVHAACEDQECQRAHSLLTDAQRTEFLRRI